MRQDDYPAALLCHEGGNHLVPRVLEPNHGQERLSEPGLAHLDARTILMSLR